MRIFPALLGLVFFLGATAWGQGPEELFRQGKQVFEDNCAQCHRANGEGLPGTFPALNGDPFVTGDPAPVLATVLNGRKGKFGQMPTWKDQLDDVQVAAVVTYIRQAWSNQASGVSPATAAKSRGK
jgi:mono/diheme cytochrome c family protein